MTKGEDNRVYCIILYSHGIIDEFNNMKTMKFNVASQPYLDILEILHVKFEVINGL